MEKRMIWFKKVKTEVELPHVDKRMTGEKAYFFQTAFLPFELNLELKNSRRKNLSRFCSSFCFSISSLHFDFKNHENVWTGVEMITGRLRNWNKVKLALRSQSSPYQALTEVLKPFTSLYCSASINQPRKPIRKNVTLWNFSCVLTENFARYDVVQYVSLF